MKKLLCAFLFFAFFLCPVCFASESTKELIESTDLSEIESFLNEQNLPYTFREMVDKILDKENPIEFSDFKDYIKSVFFGEAKNTFKMALKLVSVSVLFSLLKNIKPESFSVSVNNAAFFVFYLLVSFMLSKIFLYGVNTGKAVINNLNYLISTSMPLLMAFMAGSGAAGSAALINPIILIGIEVLSVLIRIFFMPLIYGIGVLSLFSPFSEGFNITPVLNTLKSSLKWSMGLCFSLFTGLISIYASFGSATDNLSYRAAKYVVGSAVPVVGPLLSDTMGVFTFSCAVLKNAFGIAVIFIIILLLLMPVIKLFLVMLSLNFSSLLVSSITDKKISSQLSEISGAISYILALVCLTGVLFIVCMAVIIHTANNIG